VLLSDEVQYGEPGLGAEPAKPTEQAARPQSCY
jgi:hypothetical protein